MFRSYRHYNPSEVRKVQTMIVRQHDLAGFPLMLPLFLRRGLLLGLTVCLIPYELIFTPLKASIIIELSLVCVSENRLFES